LVQRHVARGRAVQHIVPGLGAQPIPRLKQSLAPGLAPAMPTPALLRLRLRSVARFASRLVKQRHLFPILCGRGSQLCAVYHCRLRGSDSAAGDRQRRQLQRRAHARAAEQPRLHNGPQVGRAPVHPQALRGWQQSANDLQAQTDTKRAPKRPRGCEGNVTLNELQRVPSAFLSSMQNLPRQPPGRCL